MSLDQEIASHLDMLEGYMQYHREEENKLYWYNFNAGCEDEVRRVPQDRKGIKLWFKESRKFYQKYCRELAKQRAKEALETVEVVEEPDQNNNAVMDSKIKEKDVLVYDPSDWLYW